MGLSQWRHLGYGRFKTTYSDQQGLYDYDGRIGRGCTGYPPEFDLGALIKWPNDIFIGNKKVAGLLLELSAEADTVHYCLLGIGIDVNVPLNQFSSALQKDITSISAELGHEVDRASFLARILREFENHYLLIESGEYDTVIREWKSLSCTLDRRVDIRTLKNSFSGEAIDIDEFGALIIRKDNGKLERVIAGDCFHH